MIKLEIGQELKSTNGVEYTVKLIKEEGVVFKSISKGLDYWVDNEEIEKTFEIPEGLWKPAQGEDYFFFSSAGNVARTSLFKSSALDSDRIKFGNYFKTEEEALEASKKVKELLLSSKQN